MKRVLFVTHSYAFTLGSDSSSVTKMDETVSLELTETACTSMTRLGEASECTFCVEIHLHEDRRNTP